MQPSGVWALKPLADMSQAEFRDWQALLEERTGVVINEQRRAFLQTNLTARMRELGVGDYASYFRQVTDGPRGAVEWSTLLDRLTVQETRFFRHRPSFEVLESYLRGRLATDEQQHPLALWSVGCSSGEEPYSIAIYLLERWRHIDDYEVEILSSDIDTTVLAAAERGVYSARSVANLPKHYLDKYFRRLSDNEYQISRDLVAAVDFSRVNLSDAADTRRFRDIDVIFCRNLLIYYDDLSRRLAAEAMYDALNPGGFVCLGHSESMSRISSLYAVRRFPDAMVYQKPLPGERP